MKMVILSFTYINMIYEKQKRQSAYIVCKNSYCVIANLFKKLEVLSFSKIQNIYMYKVLYNLFPTDISLCFTNFLNVYLARQHRNLC